MAKKCRAAAKKRSTTREAALALRRAAAVAPSEAASAAALPEDVGSCSAASFAAACSLASSGTVARAKTWQCELTALSDAQLRRLWQLQVDWQRGTVPVPLQRLAYRPPSFVYAVHVVERRSAAQLQELVFAADWQEVKFDRELWASLKQVCPSAGGFVCDDTQQGKAAVS